MILNIKTLILNLYMVFSSSAKEAYERLNEEYVSECLRNTTEGAFLSAREKITKALQEESAEKTNGVPTAPDNVINNVI